MTAVPEPRRPDDQTIDLVAQLARAAGLHVVASAPRRARASSSPSA